MEKYKEFLTRKNILTGLLLGLVLVALPLAIALVKQRQEVRKEAAACPATSYVAFTNAAGQSITSANNNDTVKAHVYLNGNIHAADIVLGYNTTKLQVTDAGGGAVSPSGTADVNRILFIIKKAPGASTSVSGEVAVVTFKVITSAATTTTPAYLDRTTIAYNGIAGGKECGTVASLALNGTPTNTPVPGATNTPVPTVTPTIPAGQASFSLVPGSSQVGSSFSLHVNLNPGGISTNNFSIAYKFDGAKLSCSTWAISGVQTTCSASEGTASYIVFSKTGGTAINSAGNIGTATFTFKGSYKAANITYDRDVNYVYVLNAAGQRVNVSVSDYCYFMTGGTCGPTGTPTPTTGGPTATPTQPIATNTPTPTATPIVFPTTTPNPMGDNAQYLSDDLPATLTPGQTFTAHIRMKNTGTSTWKATERFHGLSASPQCSGAACLWGSSGVLVSSNVAPQATHEFVLNLTAPATLGTYDSFWQMVQSNQLFGQQGGKRIVVAAAPTATPTGGVCTKSTFPDAAGAANGGPDGKVDLLDFQRWREEFTGGLTTKTADFNCPPNGVVDLLDFNIWREYFVNHQ